uniref:Uncharacterized protein n=1 Tax=Caenorhabditis japonica TaxID=281687 RepID=A0A8R1DKF9_CAEJA
MADTDVRSPVRSDDGEGDLKIVEHEPDVVDMEVEVETQQENDGDSQSMDIEEEIVAVEEKADEHRQEESSADVAPDPEAVEKSKVQKDAFLEMFHIAPRVRDILPDLRVFISHADVIDADRKEIEELVANRVADEKAKRKAEKVAKKDNAQDEKDEQPVALADVIRSATGLDLAGILSRAGKIPVTEASAAPPPVVFQVPVAPVPIAVPVAPPTFAGPPQLNIGTASVKNIGRGKAGFSTPHPNEIPPELRLAKPTFTVPDSLRISLSKLKGIPAIPKELLPPEKRVPESQPESYTRLPLRKTLWLSGARAGKTTAKMDKEREEKENEEKRKLQEEMDKKDPLGALNRSLPPGVAPYPKLPSPSPLPEKRERGGRREREKKRPFGANSLPTGLNKNSPIAVKRFHARQLAKETGLSIEEAMAEIEEQCNEFGVEETPEKAKADKAFLEEIKQRGDSRWNERHNYTPVDHSKGIPGVDRPPMGLPPREKEKDREFRDDRGPPSSLPPMRGGGIPGIDRPPQGDRDRFDRDWDNDGLKRRDRKRGGVKERQKKPKFDNMRSGRFDNGRGPPGQRDQWGGNSGAPAKKYGRWEDNSRDRFDQSRNSRNETYNDYNSSVNTYHQESNGPEDHGQNYDGYYEGQEAYDQSYDTSQQQYSEQGYEQTEGGYGANYDYYQGQGGQESSYYQEDGSQYYNEYYGATEQTEYHATFADPAAKSGTDASAYPAPSK